MSVVEAVGATLGAVLAVLAILGAVWKWIVLPNLREQLFKPIEETRRQVTENHHRNREPTLLDRVDDLTNSLSDVQQTVDAVGISQAAVLRVAQRIRRLETRLTDHETWARQEDQFLRSLLENLLAPEDPNKRKGK